MRWLTWFVLLCAVAGCSHDGGGAGGDLLLRRVVLRGNNPAADAGFEYWGGRIRIVDDARKRLTFDLDAKTVTFVSKERGTYVVRTLDEVMRKFQRKVRDPSAGNIVLKRTGTTERIAGHEAHQYTFTTNRGPGTVWICEELRPLPAWREWEALIASVGGASAFGVEITEAVSKVGGYPLRTALTFADGNGGWTITTQVTEISPRPSDTNIVSVPEGFRRQDDLQIPE